MSAPSLAELMRNDLVQAVVRQRDTAMNNVAGLEVQVMLLSRQIEAMAIDIGALRQQAADKPTANVGPRPIDAVLVPAKPEA